MKKLITSIFVFFLTVSITNAQASGEIIQFQKVLKENGIIPLVGMYDLRVSLWSTNDANDGYEVDISNALWSETHMIETDIYGKYEIEVGSINPLPKPFDPNLYKFIQVDYKKPNSTVFRIQDAEYSISNKDRYLVPSIGYAQNSKQIQGKILGFNDNQIPYLNEVGELPNSVIQTTLNGLETSINSIAIDTASNNALIMQNIVNVNENVLAIGTQEYTGNNYISDNESVTISLDTLDRKVASNETSINIYSQNIINNTNAITTLANGITWKAPVNTFNDLGMIYGNNTLNEGYTAYVLSEDKIYILDGTGNWIVAGGTSAPNATTTLSGMVLLSGNGGINAGVVQGSDVRLSQVATNTTAITNLNSIMESKAANATLINTGDGLIGGGDLSADRMLALDFGTLSEENKVIRSQDIQAALQAIETTTGQITLIQPDHGISLNNSMPRPAYVDQNGMFRLASANSGETLTAFYITQILDSDRLTIQFQGPITVRNHGLIPGEYYFLGKDNPGTFVANTPDLSDVCLYVLTPDILILKDNRPIKKKANQN